VQSDVPRQLPKITLDSFVSDSSIIEDSWIIYDADDVTLPPSDYSTPTNLLPEPQGEQLPLDWGWPN
jgi:hypothetical protein